MEGAEFIDSERHTKMKDINNIENKYGLLVFRMALTHIMDVGHRRFDGDYANESIKHIIAQGEEDKANGELSVMSPEFQCEIVRCAADLSKFSPWTLFAYIKKHVVIN